MVRERATDWHALASHTISPYRRREQTKTKHFIQKNEGICVGSLGLEFMRATSRYDFNHLTSRSLTISFGMLDIVNIAHPAFIMLGSFVAYILNPISQSTRS